MLAPSVLLRQQLPLLTRHASQALHLALGEALPEGEVRLPELATCKRSPAFVEARGLLQTICGEAWGEETARHYWKDAFLQHLFADVWLSVLPSVRTEWASNAVYASFQAAASVLWSDAAKQKWLQPLQPYSDYILDTLDDLETEEQRNAFVQATFRDFYAAWMPAETKANGASNALLGLAVRQADFLLKRHRQKRLSESTVLDATGDWLDALLPHYDDQAYPPVYANHPFLLSYYQQSVAFSQVSHCWVNTPEQCRYGHWVSPKDSLFAVALSPNSQSIEQENQQAFDCIFADATNPQLRSLDKRLSFTQLDKRIKETFQIAKPPQRQEPSLRYFRWLLDRMGTQGIAVLTSPKLVLEHSGYEGLRACLLRELSDCYVLDAGDWLIWGLVR